MAYRELLARLVWRDVKVRYKQTAIGAAWAILQPFLTMVVFTIIFGKFAQFPSENLPYPVLVFSGLLVWMFFASAVSGSATSIVANVPLVTKVYFPRIALPLAAVAVPVVDFVLASVVLAGMMAWFSLGVGGYVLLSPLFLLLAIVTALGVGLFFSAVNVRYRDVPYAIPFMLQIWLYLSPVIYPASAWPERWEWVLWANPMTTAITGFRWAVVGTPAPTLAQGAIGVTVALVVALIGLAYFRANESRFADTI